MPYRERGTEEECSLRTTEPTVVGIVYSSVEGTAVARWRRVSDKHRNYWDPTEARRSPQKEYEDLRGLLEPQTEKKGLPVNCGLHNWPAVF